MNTFTEVQSNGSKWYGQQPDSIETLLQVITEQTLDPRFEDCGNFVFEFRPHKGWSEKNEKYRNCTCIFGNFLTYSHVFNITTNDKELINILDTAIRKNQLTAQYKEAKAEYYAIEKVKKTAQQMFYNKEIDLRKMYGYPVTEEGKELFEQYKNELLCMA